MDRNGGADDPSSFPHQLPTAPRGLGRGMPDRERGHVGGGTLEGPVRVGGEKPREGFLRALPTATPLRASRPASPPPSLEAAPPFSTCAYGNSKAFHKDRRDLGRVGGTCHHSDAE